MTLLDALINGYRVAVTSLITASLGDNTAPKWRRA
jgi:hypothetical protein